MNERAHRLIPGGAHTYAKGDDQFPEHAAPFIERGSGCRVWDVDGNCFIEYGMGLRAVTLGHAYPRVLEAVARRLDRGTNFVRPASIEVECAEAFLDIVTGAEMVKFCKDGSTANTAAITLARAYTGRPLVAICGDDPFLSYNDWFIGTTPMRSGIPDAVRALTVTFPYNDVGALERLFAEHSGALACVILEAERTEPPAPGFLERLQELCRREGTVFVLDEMITGFRWNLRGAQAEYGLQPDLSTFGKALANGFALSALAGRREIMELGGIRDERDRVFLLSTTHGAETVALAAAIAVMAEYAALPVVETLHERGARLRSGIDAAARDAGISDHFRAVGRDSNLVYSTLDENGSPSQLYRTLFLQELIARGILAPSFVVSFSHGEREIDLTVEACHEAFQVYRAALTEGIDKHLRGRPVKPVMRSLS